MGEGAERKAEGDIVNGVGLGGRRCRGRGDGDLRLGRHHEVPKLKDICVQTSGCP